MATTERIIEGLPEQTQKLLQAYSKDVKGVYNDQLEGLILYGSAVRGEFMPGRSNLNLLLVVAGYDAAMLKRYEPVHKRWSKEGIIIPLFLTDQEIRTSSALFPLEFLEIQEHHRVLGGRDPFVGFHVDVSRVEDAVMQGLAGHVLRLRQRCAEIGGANDAVMILLPLAVTSTVPLLRGIQRMRGWPVLTQSDAVIKDVADRLQIDLQGLHEALMLKRGIISPGPSEVPRVFDRYLKATTTLSEALHR
jgi:predicted nucleotidyltransferase/RNase P/RNase MRP subunit p29